MQEFHGIVLNVCELVDDSIVTLQENWFSWHFLEHDVVESNGCFVRGSDNAALGKSALKLSVLGNGVRPEGCVVIFEDPVK